MPREQSPPEQLLLLYQLVPKEMVWPQFAKYMLLVLCNVHNPILTTALEKTYLSMQDVLTIVQHVWLLLYKIILQAKFGGESYQKPRRKFEKTRKRPLRKWVIEKDECFSWDLKAGTDCRADIFGRREFQSPGPAAEKGPLPKTSLVNGIVIENVRTPDWVRVLTASVQAF